MHSTNDRFWERLAAELRSRGVVDVPDRLDRTLHYEEQWSSDNFLLGQACGYDVRIAHAVRLSVVATPRYLAPGCEGTRYRSFIVVRDDAPYDGLTDLRGARCVVNTPTSHSGMNILRSIAAPLHENGRFFGSVQISGSHTRSLNLIRSGTVDVASIDCVTHALLQRHRPDALHGTHVLHSTETHAAPPFVTSIVTPRNVRASLRESLTAVLRDDAMRGVLDDLLLDGVEILPLEDYESIESIEDSAEDLGYEDFLEVSDD